MCYRDGLQVDRHKVDDSADRLIGAEAGEKLTHLSRGVVVSLASSGFDTIPEKSSCRFDILRG